MFVCVCVCVCVCVWVGGYEVRVGGRECEAGVCGGGEECKVCLWVV